MSGSHPPKNILTTYIETPRHKRRPEKIDRVLQKRMKEFIRYRRRQSRQEAAQ